jgi:tetratricopeptide (TPR) repeat protein
MSLVKNADESAIVAYGQAINLDPLNPVLRIELGGVYYGTGNYDEAIKQFAIAVQMKPDFANAHYNLSSAYKAKKDFKKAAAEMEAILAIVPKDSEDYKKAQTELEELKAQVPPEETETDNPTRPGETLTAPAKPTPVLRPPLELPAEATPPATNPVATGPPPAASPSPAPSPS